MSINHPDRDVVLHLFRTLKEVFQDELAEYLPGENYDITFFNPDTAKAAELQDALISDEDGKHRVRIRLVSTTKSANTSEATPLANYFVTIEPAALEESFEITGIGDILSTRRGTLGPILDMARRLIERCRSSRP